MSPATLLFDLDGTLTDPAPGFLASLRHAMETLGVMPPPAETLTRFIGPPLRQSMGTLLGTDDRETIERAVELYRWRLDQGGKFEATVIEGIPRVLAHFQERGHRLYVCTGKPEGVAMEIVEHFGLSPYFIRVFGAQLDGRHGDKAELIAHIWEEEKIGSRHGVMIGDTRFDMAAGRANGLFTVGVRWGYGTEEDLKASGAARLVSRAEELVDAIESAVHSD